MNTITFQNQTGLKKLESEIFDKYKEPGKNYEAFQALSNGMNAGTINDTPKDAYILGEEIPFSEWETRLKTNKYGFAIINEDRSYHVDITSWNPEKMAVTCKTRNIDPKFRQEAFEIDLGGSEIFEITKRNY